MTASNTNKFAMPFLQPGQALKMITHNEAVRRLDAGLYLSCSNMAAQTLPENPEAGQTLIMASSASGDNPGDIGVYDNDRWIWFSPTIGWIIWDAADETPRVFDGTTWVGPMAQSDPDELPQLGLNTSASLTQRLAVASDSSLFTHDGRGHQITLNRAAETNTASLLFQTAYSGNAEIGLTGTEGFSLKTSPDGQNWTRRLSVSDTSNGIQSPSFSSLQISILNDKVQFVETPSTGGMFTITVFSENGHPQVNRSGLIAYDTESTPSLASLAVASHLANHGNMVLDGSISPDGFIGLSAVEGGIFIENRIGHPRQIRLTFLG